MTLEVPEFTQALSTNGPNVSRAVCPHAGGEFHTSISQQGLDAETNTGRPNNPIVFRLAAAKCQAGLRGRPALVDMASNEDAPSRCRLAGPLTAGPVSIRVYFESVRLLQRHAEDHARPGLEVSRKSLE